MLSSSARIYRACLALCLLAALSAAAPIKETPKSPDNDLWLIPPDAQVVYALRIADLMKTEAVKEIFKSLPAPVTTELKKFEGQFGLALTEINRFMIMSNEMDKDTLLGTVLTLRDIDVKKTLEALSATANGERPEEKKVGDRTLYIYKANLFQRAKGMAVAFVDARLIVFGDETEIKKALERNATKPEGLLAAAIVKTSRNPFVLAFALTKSMRDVLRNQFQVEYRPLADLETIALGINLGKEEKAVEFVLNTNYPDEPAAREAAKIADSGKEALRVMLGLARAAIPDKDALAALDAVDKVLKGVKIEQADKEVVAKSQLDVDLKTWIQIIQSPGGPFGGIGGGPVPPEPAK